MLNKILDDYFDKNKAFFDRKYLAPVKTIIKDCFISGEDIPWTNLYSYSEFPLNGDKWLDFTVIRSPGLAFEYDLSTRGIKDPSPVHFFHRYVPGQEEDILEPIGAVHFADCLRKKLANGPSSISFQYAGYFKSRGRDYLRLGTYYTKKTDPVWLLSTLKFLGYTNITGDLVDIIRDIIGMFEDLEVCLDLLSDGSIRDKVGLIFNLPVKGTKDKTKAFYKNSGYEDFLSYLQKREIIDDRWKAIEDAIYTGGYRTNVSGKDFSVGVVNSFRGVKLAWEEGKMLMPKAYMDFAIY